jgi:hypothetical protein
MGNYKIWVSLGDPASATLSVRYEADTFYAELTDSIPSTTITIAANTLSVLGYDDSSCGSLSGESDSASNNLVITAGTTNDTEPGNFGFTTNTTYYNFPGNLTINGTLRADGDVFTIGGTSVTLSYPYGAGSGCDPYFD